MKTLLMTIALLLSVGAVPGPARADGPTPDEYAVWSAFVKGDLSEAQAREKRVLVLGVLATGEDVMAGATSDIHDQCPDAPGDLPAAFESELRNGGFVDADAFTGVSVATISQEELTAMFGKGVGEGWEQFRRKYESNGGFWTFSHVAFDRSGSWAVFYAALSCGSLCGEGNYVVMKRSETGWTVAKRIPLWIS